MPRLGKIIARTAIPIGNREIAALSSAFLRASSSERQVKEFEQDLSTYLGVQRVYAFNTGRTALSVALQALELKPNTEVLVPAYTCAIVFEVALRLGLKVAPVDVDPRTYNIDPDKISQSIKKNTQVIIPVHLFGQPCQMDKILETSKEHNLFVIEDAAQALGSKYKKTKVGTFGDISIFSFGPGKSITAGQGGSLAVNNAQFEDKVHELQARLKAPNAAWSLTVRRNILAMRTFSNSNLYGRIRNRLEESLLKDDEHIVENCISLAQHSAKRTLNPTVRMFKMPAISARIAKIQLTKLDSLNQKRKSNAEELSKLLDNMRGVLALPETCDVEHTFTRFAVRILKGSRENLMAKLLEQGIDTERPYSYLPKVLKALQAETPIADELAHSVLTLPNHPLVKSSDRVHIANALTGELKSLPTGN